jgi:hypothetical protein
MLATFIITGNYFFLAAPLMWFFSLLYASMKFLDKKEIILLPITYTMLVIFLAALYIDLSFKRLLGKKIEWYKTPKHNL